MPAEAHPEPPAVASRTVVAVALAFLVFVAVAAVALRAYFLGTVTEPVVVPPRPFPEPQLQTDQRGERLRLEADQAGRLDGYAWIDRDHGIARIPIDRAMALLAARGANAYAPLEPAPAPTEARP